MTLTERIRTAFLSGFARGHADFMKLAIKMAAKCNPADPALIPRVGAVIVIDE